MNNLVTIYYGGTVEYDRYGYIEFVDIQSVSVLFNDRPSFSEMVARAQEELHCLGDDGIAVDGVLHLGSPCRHRIFISVLRTHAASRKGPLVGADPPSFSARVVDPTQSSRDMPINLTLQLTRRESSSVIKGGNCRCCQTVPNVRL